MRFRSCSASRLRGRAFNIDCRQRMLEGCGYIRINSKESAVRIAEVSLAELPQLCATWLHFFKLTRENSSRSLPSYHLKCIIFAISSPRYFSSF